MKQAGTDGKSVVNLFLGLKVYENHTLCDEGEVYSLRVKIEACWRRVMAVVTRDDQLPSRGLWSRLNDYSESDELNGTLFLAISDF